MIRYAVAPPPRQPAPGPAAGERAAAAQQAARLRGLAHALATPAALFTGRNWLARRRLRRPAAAIGARWSGGATCCRWRSSRRSRGCPPTRRCPGWPAPGPAPSRRRPPSRVPGPGARPLGVSDAGAPRPVGLAVADARHHLRVCGPTGSGKTTLIAGQILADADAGRGVVFIDPKGDAVTDILARLPEAPPARSCCSTPATGAPRRA